MSDTRIDLTIIPAAPGYFVFYLHDDMVDEPVEQYWLTPVIAWRIKTCEGKGRSANGDIWSDAEPITPGGEVSNDYMIVRPDGCVEHPCNTTYESIAAAVTGYLKERAP